MANITHIDQISPSLQDYLEAILELLDDTNVATISDISRRLQISKPSATRAVKRLNEMGLARHEHYGNIELTETGNMFARQVQRRHRLLKTFLSDFLGLVEAIAERDACAIEHSISNETMESLVKFVEQNKDKRFIKLKRIDKTPRKGDAFKMAQGDKMKLSDLPVGGKGQVVSVGAKDRLRRRIMDMGLVPGVEVEVVGVAPLGDPIELVLRGYNLTLRKDEAEVVLVEVV